MNYLVNGNKKPPFPREKRLKCTPARTSPTQQNIGPNETSSESTPKSTPQPAEMFAECIREHLADEHLAELLHALQGTVEC